MFKFLSATSLLVATIFLAQSAYAGTLSCSVTTAASCTGTTILRLSNASGGHVELPSQANGNYAGNVICCSGPSGLGNSCTTGATTTVLRLSGATNAHTEQAGQTNVNYNANNACISVGTGGTVSIGYQSSNCSGYDTTLGSMSAITNAHVGSSPVYSSIQICGSATGTVALLNTTGTVTSAVFDASASSTYNSIYWKGSLGTGGTGKVRFQFAASDSSTGPWNYYGGSTCAVTDWFNTSGPSSAVELIGSGASAGTCRTAFNNKRYYRYKVQICSNDCATGGQYTPTVTGVVMSYAP